LIENGHRREELDRSTFRQLDLFVRRTNERIDAQIEAMKNG
jgi:hypothetical protein